MRLPLVRAEGTPASGSGAPQTACRYQRAGSADCRWSAGCGYQTHCVRTLASKCIPGGFSLQHRCQSALALREAALLCTCDFRPQKQMSDAQLPEKTRAEQSDGSAQRLRLADVQNAHGPLARPTKKSPFSAFCLLGKKGIKPTRPPISCHVSRVIPDEDATTDGSSGAGTGVGVELRDSPDLLRLRSQI